MMNLRSFIESIQQAVLAANDALVDKNTGLLDQFFEKDQDVATLQSRLDAAIEASDSLNSGEGRPNSGQLRNAAKAFKDL